MKFYDPVNNVKVRLSQSVNLPFFSDRLSPLSSLPVFCAKTFASNRQLPFSNQRKALNSRRNYFIGLDKSEYQVNFVIYRVLDYFKYHYIHVYYKFLLYK